MAQNPVLDAPHLVVERRRSPAPPAQHIEHRDQPDERVERVLAALVGTNAGFDLPHELGQQPHLTGATLGDPQPAPPAVGGNALAPTTSRGRFMDPLAVTFADDSVQYEERSITVGHSTRDRLLFVVHSERSVGVVRLISARKATPKESRAYEEGI